MVESWTRGMKTTSRLGLAIAGAALLLAVGPSALAQAAPTLTIESPSPSSVTGSSNVPFSGKTTDPSGSILLSIVGARHTVHEVVPVTAEDWTASVPLADDTYTVTAEQAGGLEPPPASEPVTFTVKTKKPAVNISTPSVMGQSVRLAGRAGDEPGDFPEVVVSITKQGSETAQVVKVVPEGDEWRVEGLELPAGKYIVRAAQRDSVHEEPGEALETFTITSKGPTVTLASSSFTVQNGTPVTSSASPPFATEAAPGLSAVTLKIYSGTSTADEQPLQQIAMTNSGDVWTATPAPLANGIYTAQASVEDVHEATGVSEPLIFSVQVPAPTTIAPVAPGPSGPTASFTWVPATPAAGQSVSLVSNSANGSSPISAFAWDVAGNSSFTGGGSVMTTAFATAGAHIVHLRVTDGNGLANVATRTISVGPPALKLLQPFPIVRIAGAETGAGVRIRLLTVQAPLSATVAVTCKGTGCKTKSESRVATASAKNKSKGGVVMLTFQHFERALRAGVVLQIRVTKAGQIGKFTSFKIRRHKLPLRSDSCLSPASPAPIACPTS